MPTKDYKRDHLLPGLRESADAVARYIAAALQDGLDCPEAIALAFQDVAEAYELPIDVSMKGAAWQSMETAPKDGTWILAHGMAYEELAERGDWFTHDTDKPLVPLTRLIRWVEGWYDKEVDHGDGSYHKEPTLSYAYWGPHAYAFQPGYWMSLPEPPNPPESK